MQDNEIYSLSEELKLQRFKHKKSQEDCAKLLEISVPTYREYEYHPNKLSLEQAFILSEYLDWNMFEFFLNNILQNAIKNQPSNDS